MRIEEVRQQLARNGKARSQNPQGKCRKSQEEVKMSHTDPLGKKPLIAVIVLVPLLALRGALYVQQLRSCRRLPCVDHNLAGQILHSARFFRRTP
jgi:hypothetical protein